MSANSGQSPDTGRIARLVRTLSVELRLTRSVLSLARCVAEHLGAALSDHRVVVRLVQPPRSDILAACAGASAPDSLAAAPIVVDPAAAEAIDERCAQTLGDLLLVEEPYAPLFDDSDAGLGIPLVADGRLYGLINLEVLGSPRIVDEARLVGQVAGDLLTGTLVNRSAATAGKFVRQLLSSLFDQANILIFVLDSRLEVTMFNRELCRLTGLAPADVLGDDLATIVPASDRAMLLARLQPGCAGHGESFPLTLNHKDGGAIETFFNLVFPDEMDQMIVAVGRDVSAEKHLEHQVIQAEKLATLGQLAAGVVHEINNPLTSISVYINFLLKKYRERGADPADLSRMEKILAGSNRILKFSRDLVNYAKPSGEDYDALSLNSVVMQAVSFCEHIRDRSGARIQMELCEDLSPLYGIKDQLLQVMINLVTNACHSLGAEGGDVRILTSMRGEDQVAAEVIDTGGGISSEDLPSIFEPFFSTKRPGDGTGLGLSIVKKIIDLHNGSIMVQSDPPRGTTFSIILPTGHRSGEK